MRDQGPIVALSTSSQTSSQPITGIQIHRQFCMLGHSVHDLRSEWSALVRSRHILRSVFCAGGESDGLKNVAGCAAAAITLAACQVAWWSAVDCVRCIGEEPERQTRACPCRVSEEGQIATQA